jgi:hypothetical protein
MRSELTHVLTTLVVALIVAAAGLWVYFRQKEYELVKQRYLEQAIDLVCSDLMVLSGTFGQNWSHCLQLVKTYRDLPETIDPSTVFSSFKDLDTSNFNSVAHYRLRILVGSNIFWLLYQCVLGRYNALNNIVTHEVPHAIWAHVSHKVTADHDGIVATATEQLKPMMDKADHFAAVGHALHELSTILEQERLSFRKLANFSQRKDVQEIIESLRSRYEAELSEAAL